MIRRFNPTKRLSLDGKDVQVLVTLVPEPSVTVKWDPGDKRVPADGRVVLEATTSGSTQVLRYDWGTWAEPKLPSSTSLSELGSDVFRFAFKVVEPESGRILAASWNLRAEKDANKGSTDTESLLVVVKKDDMGQELWTLEIRDDGAYLNVNANIPAVDTTTRGPFFVALVYPSALRSVLRSALKSGVGEDGVEWANAWVKFAQGLDPISDEKLQVEDGADLSAEQEEWIDSVARSFCEKHRTLDEVRTALEGGR